MSAALIPAATRAPIEAWRAAGEALVFTNGVFDLLHRGHVEYLEEAAAFGDRLVVGINSDDSVRRLKGPRRPIVPESERAELVAALACVDAVEIFPEDTPATALQRLRPDVWVKGGDYAGRPLPEAAVLERWGGRVVVVPALGAHSTTRIIEEAITRVV